LVRLGFELRACKAEALPLEPHLQSILLCLFLEIGSCELFAWAGLEPWSSWTQPPKQLGLQAVASFS
jgi:hypothetical protein